MIDNAFTAHQIRILSGILWSPSDIIEIRTLPPLFRQWTEADNICRFVPELLHFNNDGNNCNIYFGVLPRKKHGGGTQDDVASGRVLWADLDHVDRKEAGENLVKSKLPHPSLIIFSGHGYHFYWRLNELLPPEELSTLCKSVSSRLNSDSKVCDSARLLRFPGFFNRKDAPVLCEITYSGIESYDVKDFNFTDNHKIQSFLPEIKTDFAGNDDQALSRAWSYLSRFEIANDGSRSSQTYRAVASCKDFGLKPAEVLWIMGRYNSIKNNPPLPEGELADIVNNGFRYSRKPAGCKIEQLQVEQEKIEINQLNNDDVIKALQQKFETEKTGKELIKLPWKILDFQIGGLRRGTLNLLGGKPKTGKSYFLIQIAMYLSEQGINWKYLPLEDNRVDFTRRLLCFLENNFRMISEDVEAAAWREAKLSEHSAELKEYLGHVTENPRIGVFKNGKVFVPRISFEWVLEWAHQESKKNSVLFIDPLAQIYFNPKDKISQEGDFVRELLAISKENNCAIVVAAHETKGDKSFRNQGVDESNLQGAAEFSRLGHTLILMERHIEQCNDIYGLNVMGGTWHNRTVHIPIARNGPGSGSKLAFSQLPYGPEFGEIGMIVPAIKYKVNRRK